MEPCRRLHRILIPVRARRRPNNVSGVETGYRELARSHSGHVVLVPNLSVSDTHDLIVGELHTAGLAYPDRA
jgi:hypothetical protein